MVLNLIELIEIVFGLLVLITIVYVLEKIYYRPMTKDKHKKLSISYYIDKYIFKKDSKTWASY